MIAIVFDPHQWLHKRLGGALVRGINRRGQLGLNVLHSAIDVANEHDAELVIAGDLIDSAGPVQPQFAYALRQELARCNECVHLLLGNHDMVADDDHSLGIYESGNPQDRGSVKVIDHIRRWAKLGGNGTSWSDPQGQVVLVPFNADVHDTKVRDCPLLIGHFGVYDERFPIWLRQSSGAWDVDALFEFMKERNVRVAACGDWHTRNIWQCRDNIRVIHSNSTVCLSELTLDRPDNAIILQGGALISTGFDNPGLHGYGTVALWDGERLSWQELPGPRFCVVYSDEEEAKLIAEAKQLGHSLFLRRFYSGRRPSTPPGLEAYETLPVAIEGAARRAAQRTAFGQRGMETVALHQLIDEWVQELKRKDECSDAEAVELLIKEYT